MRECVKPEKYPSWICCSLCSEVCPGEGRHVLLDPALGICARTDLTLQPSLRLCLLSVSAASLSPTSRPKDTGRLSESQSADPPGV